ncbi:Gfo/Idh/MocA family oxidoreductase [Puteibacter caeruleilacunae]|nr:Gfo/Idh/MocA family oxidoreductase [Puteibacter caeruleilacunae]
MKNNSHNKQASRRKFLKNSLIGGSSLMILPSHVIAGVGTKPPASRLNIAGIGVGGMGLTNLRNMSNENIVALCDVDWDYADTAFKRFPHARRYKDFRIMLEKQKDIDAVVVATPDHLHAIAAQTAMQLGKHVFVQTPLTHAIYESRLLSEAAGQMKMATQMGNQGSSGDGVRQICEWIWAGLIGEVKEVHAWTNRPNLERPISMDLKDKRVPGNLNWDLFLGPAQWREYNPEYTPYKWRNWWAFGSGSLGEMGGHILDPVFKALKLKYPKAVEASSSAFNLEIAPQAEKVTWWFPRRDNLPKVAMPEVKINWYDGGLLPNRPEGLHDSISLWQDENGGLIFQGSEGTIICGAYGNNPMMIGVKNVAKRQPVKTLRRISDAEKGGHEKDWVRACKEGASNRLNASSSFDVAGPITEAIQLGNIAIRLQGLNRRLLWDGDNMQFLNLTDSDYIEIDESKVFQLNKGVPSFDIKRERYNVKQLIEEWIRPTYRDGWNQL